MWEDPDPDPDNAPSLLVFFILWGLGLFFIFGVPLLGSLYMPVR